MAIPVILPKQGQSVETCAIVGWKKRVGDAVKAGEVLCEVETDKASFEIESPADGTLLAIYREAGSQVPVLETIAVIGTPGEKVATPTAATAPAAASAPAPASSTAPASLAPAVTVAPAAPVPGGKIAASPRARALAAANAVTLSGIRGTGPGGRIIERDVKQAMADGAGTAAGATAAPAPAAPRPAAAALPSGGIREIKVTGVRKLIAERMLASLDHDRAAHDELLRGRARPPGAPREVQGEPRSHGPSRRHDQRHGALRRFPRAPSASRT